MKTLLPGVFAAAILLFGSPAAFSQGAGDIEYRDFTGSNGKTIKAVLVDKTDENVTLLLANGQRATIAYDKLSEADQEFAKSWNKGKAIFLQQCRGLTVRQLLELRGYESFKYTLKGNHVIVDGELNGTPAEFMIDTGAHSSVLHLQSAQNAGCRVGEMDQKIRGIGGEAPAAWTEVDEIRLGESVIKDQRLLSADLMKDRPPGSKKMEDAIFGADFLTQLRAVISYREGRIFLRPDLADGNEESGEAPDFRLFKSSDGSTIRGDVAEKTTSAVKIRTEDGKEQQVAISRLSPEDQQYIADWSPERAAFMKHCRGLTVEELLELREYESFEYERRGNHIYVDGHLNEMPSTFLIDTGAGTSLLHIEAARKAKCDVGGFTETIFGVGGEAPAAVSKVALLKMGKADITNRSILAADLFKDLGGEPNFDAIFGADFLRELNGVITYRESRIFLRQK